MPVKAMNEAGEKGMKHEAKETPMVEKREVYSKPSPPNPAPKSPKAPAKSAPAHRGFKAVQAEIAAKEGISKDRAGAILAASARKASQSAVNANPRLSRVNGAKKPTTGRGKK